MPIPFRQFLNRTSITSLGIDVHSALNHEPDNIITFTTRRSHHRCPSGIVIESTSGCFCVSAAFQQQLHYFRNCVTACFCERRPRTYFALRCWLDDVAAIVKSSSWSAQNRKIEMFPRLNVPVVVFCLQQHIWDIGPTTSTYFCQRAASVSVKGVGIHRVPPGSAELEHRMPPRSIIFIEDYPGPLRR